MTEEQEVREELKNQDLQRDTTCESEACVRKPFVLPAGCPVITPPVIPEVTFCETPTLATVPDSPIDLGLTLDCPVPKLKLSGPICGTFSTDPKDSCRATLQLKVPQISITGTCAVDVHKTPAGHRPGDCDNVEYKISVKKFALKPVVESDCEKDPTAYIVTNEGACEVKNELHINIPNPRLSVNVVPVCDSEPTGTLEAAGCENILRLEIPRPRELGVEIEPVCGDVSPSGYWDFGEGGTQEDSAEDKCRATLKLRIPQPPELSVDIVQECDREEPSGEVVDPEEVSFDSTESGCRKTIKLRIPKTPTPLLLMTSTCKDEEPRIYTCTDGNGNPIRLASGTAACDICKPAYLLKIPKPPVWRSIVAVTEDGDCGCTQHTGGTWECCPVRKPEVEMTFLTDTAVEVPENAIGDDGRPYNCGGVIKSIIKIPRQCKPTFMGTFSTGDDQHGYTPPKIEVSSEATSVNNRCIQIVNFHVPAPPPPVTMTGEGDIHIERSMVDITGPDGIKPAMQWKLRSSGGGGMWDNKTCMPWLVKAYKVSDTLWTITMCDGNVLDIASGAHALPVFGGRSNQMLRDGPYYLYYEYSYDYHTGLPYKDSGNGNNAQAPRGLFWNQVANVKAGTNCIVVLIAWVKAEKTNGSWEAKINQQVLGMLSVIRSVPELM